jgi:fructoselysine-6-P-deglycase FrlB-like protein
MASLYEANILNQPLEWKRLLNSPIPIELKNIQANKIIFIGLGSSYLVARFAEFLWRDYNSGAAIHRLLSRVLTLLEQNMYYQKMILLYYSRIVEQKPSA